MLEKVEQFLYNFLESFHVHGPLFILVKVGFMDPD